MKYKIALDTSVSFAVEMDLKSRGHKIIHRAKASEADRDWVISALEKGANLFISPDLDIPNLLDHFRSEAIWLDVPQNSSGAKLSKHLLEKIKGLAKK